MIWIFGLIAQSYSGQSAIHHSCREPRGRTPGTRDSEPGRVFPLASSTVGSLAQANAVIAQEGWQDRRGQKPIRASSASHRRAGREWTPNKLYVH